MPTPLKIAKWFKPFLYPCEYKNLYGGRGSGKSHHVAILAVARMANLFRDPDNLKYDMPYYPYKKVRILSGREFNTTIEASVKVVLEEKIYEMGLNDQFIIKNDEIVHRESRSQCLFRGLGRNINNVRSAEAIDVWWFEEAQFLTTELMDIVIPTARYEYRCPITDILYLPEKWTVWNPQSRADWVFQRFVVKPREDDLSLHINYMHNPYLPTVTLREALIEKEQDPVKYAHIWEGQPDDTNADKQILPYPFVQACIDAWHKRPNLSEQMRTDAGFDIALGGADNCALAVRSGPVLHDIKVWNGEPDLNALARQANKHFETICERVGARPSKIWYDGNHPMVGAFRAVGEVAPSEGVLFGGVVLGKDTIWEKKIKNSDYFAKRNIQMGIGLRLRAARTKRLLDGEEGIDPWQCLFINPNIKDLPRITSMLTQPVQRTGASGRLEIDKRGLENDGESPDEFDALCLAFHQDLNGGLKARE